MVRIQRFDGYSAAVEMAEGFLDAVPGVMVSEAGKFGDLISKITADLKINAGVIMSFGTGMDVMIPLVHRLVENGELKVDLNPETVALLTLTSITIAYLQEERDERARHRLERDSKSLLEELKLRGIGNGIVKKVVGCLKAVGAVAKLIMRHKGHVLTSLFEMLAYSALCVPVVSALKALVGTYHFTVDNFPNHMASLGVGLASLGAKQGIEYLRNLVDKAREGDDEGPDQMINEQ